MIMIMIVMIMMWRDLKLRSTRAAVQCDDVAHSCLSTIGSFDCWVTDTLANLSLLLLLGSLITTFVLKKKLNKYITLVIQINA